MTEELKTIEAYWDVLDYYAMIELDIITDPIQKVCLIQGAWTEEVGGKMFARAGILRDNGTGTLMTKEQFQPWFDQYGGVMFNKAEWALYKAEFAPVEAGIE